MEAHHRVSGPTTGKNSGGRRIIKKMYKTNLSQLFLLNMFQVDLALPGHNAALNWEGVMRASERHLQGADLRLRALKKLWPRFSLNHFCLLHLQNISIISAVSK